MQIRRFSFPLIAFLFALPLYSQDGSDWVTLHGNVHPLAQARYDRGAANGALPTGRLLLLLNRPAERETALEQYLSEVHDPGSPNYHRWITPAEFGDRFGPRDSDIQTVSRWLTAKGLQLARVSAGKTLIEFSGNFRQIAGAFHTQIHRYQVNGELHYANATDPLIPRELADIVSGISPLHDFRAKPQIQIGGTANLDPATGRLTSKNTLKGQNGTVYGISPPDFATQYDVTPIYASGINGRGTTIGIINDSNLDLTQVNAYRGMFNPSGSPVEVVVDGGDPGANGDEIEAYLDVEVAGSVAPGAAVYLYIATVDLLDDPLILAATRAIEDNQADVLSVSFASCEAALGASHNQLVNALWQESAALGQTVFVSAGDNGSAGCDPHGGSQIAAANGLAVNGLASTPWNVAVGGTDFYYSDYASGAPSAAAQWNANNGSDGGSLKASLTEQVWNDQLGFNIAPGSALGAGSGGVSTVYTKPAWQTALGVPTDGQRDVPDVSLFAGDGANLSYYVICANPGDCVPGTNGQIPVFLVGGTSAATPAMAGIMALIDQQYGRQGQANFTLYPLARQAPAAFHDITLGGNDPPCVQNSPDCVLASAGGQYTSSGYPAAPGYDLASGLGSLDAKVLFDNWNRITLLPTSTSLSLSAAKATHGTPITLTADVTHSAGNLPPTGNVSILTAAVLPTGQAAGLLTVGANGSASAALDTLPGGTYQLWAHYAGDGFYSGSVSTPVKVSVAPEPSQTGISANQMVGAAGPNNTAACFPEIGQSTTAVAAGSTVFPSTVLWLNVQPTGAVSGLENATGSVTFSLDGQAAATVPLNVAGVATWPTPADAFTGTHSVTASYSGDASYNPSQASPFTYTVEKGRSILNIGPGGVCGTGIACTAYQGDTYPVEIYLFGGGCLPLSGSATVSLGSQTRTVTLTPAGSQGSYASPILTGVAAFSNVQPGTYPLTANYVGDNNYQGASVSPGFEVQVTPSTGARVPTTTSLTESSATLQYNSGNAEFRATVTGSAGSAGLSGAPTGTVTVYANGLGATAIYLTQSGPQSSSGMSIPVPWDGFSLGQNEITAVYSGDSIYKGSVSASIPLSVVVPGTPDFTMTPSAPQLTLKEGSSAATSINLASANGFKGAVSLSCTASSPAIGCAVSPASVNLNGTSVASLTLTTAEKPPCGRALKPATSNIASVVLTGVANGILHATRIALVVQGMRATANPQLETSSGKTCP